MKTAQLLPFSRREGALTIGSHINLVGGQLKANFLIDGTLSDIVIDRADGAAIKCNGRRADSLWEHTCFELFLKLPGGNSTRYWELNMSPTGLWNCYRFENYRQGMVVEESIDNILMRVEDGDSNCHIAYEFVCDISCLLDEQQSCAVGVTAVVEHADASHSFWAISHMGTQPDFHLADSFVLMLP
jgi:hypothetical protein